MSYHRRVHETPDLPHGGSVTLPDGRRIAQGQEFSVKGEGRFTFTYEWQPDGSLTAYGPVGKQSAQWRSFRPSAVTTVHSKTLSRKDTT